MTLKIRLRQQGRKNRQTYRLVLTESRSPRDGKYLEALGWYNPFETEMEKHIHIQADRVAHWLDQGAVITEKAAALLKKSCPQVIEVYRQRALAKKAKICEKKRSSKSEPKAKKEAVKKEPAKATEKAKAAPAKKPAAAKKTKAPTA